MNSHTLIFDIETVGEAWDTLDTTTQTLLTRWVDRAITDLDAHEVALRDIREGLGFSPLTGSIVAIGLFDLERERGVVYYASDTDTEDTEYKEFVLKPRTEKEMLEDFWEGAKEYDTFVTFNGRGFDVPFLNLRSAIQGIRPTHDLMEGRYLYQQKYVRHVDLQDQLTFYGAVHRRPSLHLFCRKNFRDIATYNAGDVTATTELYKQWVTYLAPRSFTDY
jgi:DNA polymerase elongation subunit (family B)